MHHHYFNPSAQVHIERASCFVRPNSFVRSCCTDPKLTRNIIPLGTTSGCRPSPVECAFEQSNIHDRRSIRNGVNWRPTPCTSVLLRDWKFLQAFTFQNSPLSFITKCVLIDLNAKHIQTAFRMVMVTDLPNILDPHKKENNSLTNIISVANGSSSAK